MQPLAEPLSRVERVAEQIGSGVEVHAVFDHEPPIIPDDILTNPDATDGLVSGSNRTLSPLIGLPALTVPAGFTSTDLPVGIDLLGPFTEELLFQIGYAYEQSTMHRRAPTATRRSRDPDTAARRSEPRRSNTSGSWGPRVDALPSAWMAARQWPGGSPSPS